MPTNISTNSEPEIEKNGTFDSPATAFARSVLPVPGGPTSSAPFGMIAPISLYFAGLCIKSTISVKASFASSCPATSEKVLPVCASTYTLALLFPKVIAFPPILFCMEFVNNCPIPIKIIIGSIHDKIKFSKGEFSFGITLENLTWAECRRLTSSGSSTRPVTNMFSLPVSSSSVNAIWFSCISTAFTLPFSICVRNVP